MLCDNCGKREANVKYSENINGRKKELILCEECSHKLGIDKVDFSMPINFSNFFEGFLDNFGSNEFMPMLNDLKALKCNSCGYTFDNIANTGRLGCKDCYSVFEDRLDPIIKRIQGSNKHVGRIGKIIDSKIDNKNVKNIEEKSKSPISEKEKLESKLKDAIKEERYEDAAKIRDKIKKLNDK